MYIGTRVVNVLGLLGEQHQDNLGGGRDIMLSTTPRKHAVCCI